MLLGASGAEGIFVMCFRVVAVFIPAQALCFRRGRRVATRSALPRSELASAALRERAPLRSGSASSLRGVDLGVPFTPKVFARQAGRAFSAGDLALAGTWKSSG